MKGGEMFSFCWHKFSKWEQYEQRILSGWLKDENGRPVEGVESWQKQKCEKCGFERHKRI